MILKPKTYKMTICMLDIIREVIQTNNEEWKVVSNFLTQISQIICLPERDAASLEKKFNR